MEVITEKIDSELIIAIEGCCHGTGLEKMGKKVDLLIICGDFQALRNKSDMDHMAVPDHYKNIGTFHKYYSGECVAPVLTIFIGGNHEASNYAQELPYGGWVAKNIYYMGYASVLNFGGLRIAGLSGIYNKHHYFQGHFEQAPYDNSDIRSVYHVRQIEIFKLLQLNSQLDIFISHDWPLNIHKYGNTQDLLRRKPYFEKEINEGTLGNPATEKLIHILQPNYWFSAHLHVKFAAIINHPEGKILTIPVKGNSPKVLAYDLEWLTILKSVDFIDASTPSKVQIPTSDQTDKRSNFQPTQEEKDQVAKLFPEGYLVSDNFVTTSVCYPEVPVNGGTVANPQTKLFCETLGIKNYFVFQEGEEGEEQKNENPEEIKLDDDLFC